MKATLNVNVGAMVLFQNKICVITAVLELETYQLRDSVTGADYQAKLADLSTVQSAELTHLDSIPEQKWQLAQQHFYVIEPLIRNPKRSKSDVQARAAECGVHISTVYRWLKSYKESGVLTALTRKQRSDSGKTQLSDDVEQLIRQVLEVDYLSTQRKSIQKIIREITRRCHKQNLPAPHANTIRSRIKNIAPQIKIAKRLSHKAAEMKFSPLQGSISKCRLSAFSGTNRSYKVRHYFS
ncbi:TPA: helix-turn-helix domain-containing protein [Neisseria meningitidis]